MTRALILPLLWACIGIGLAVWSIPAWGQTCGDFDALDAKLKDEFNERWHIVATDPSGTAFIFYGNPDTETWTIVWLRHGCATVVASGENYQALAVFPGDAS